MFSFETLLIVLVLGFCAYASYMDLKHQKIPNICSFGLLYVGILYQGIAFYKGTLPLGTVLINILVGGILVVALYWFGVIAPADAKLLWGASLALPITLFQQEGSILFPSLVDINALSSWLKIIHDFIMNDISLQQSYSH